MPRKNKQGDYSYSRTAKIRGHEKEDRYAVIQIDDKNSHVVPRRPDGTANGAGILVRSSDLIDLKPTLVVPLGQRGTLTLPGEFRRDLGIEEGTMLEIMQEADGRLSIRPLRPVVTVDLDALLAGVTPENIHEETDFGPAVGREVE